MCGIAGFVEFSDPHHASESVSRMVGALERRGPDSSGTHAWPRAVLGHRRLAIFDLSAAGHQPMLSDDGTIGIVFNGAIYNFLELRAELEARGVRFRSRTDTEVLVYGYREWGIDELVRRSQGMFAFALWDDRKQQLWLVRDRLGVKPLLFVEQDGAIAFASTARSLRASGLGGELDPAAVGEYLEYGFVTEDRAIYASMQKVAPATIVEFTHGRLRSRQYWTPPHAAETLTRSFDAVVDETESLLLRATERRLHADVPVGALLSGGIDSALVCWAIQAHGGDVTAYTVGTPGQATDETAAATETARELGIRHEVLPLSDAESTDLTTLVTAYAEPFGCASALGMLKVSHAIAQSPAKVLLTGDGGDDVFLGYPRHRMLMQVERAARFLPSIATPLWRAVRNVLPREGSVGRAVHLADYVTGGLGAFLSATPGLPGFRSRGILGPRLLDAVVPARTIKWSVNSARHVLDGYLAHDLRTQFVSEYLTKVDGATMHYGLEARSPFFDQGLWEFASSLPTETRLRGGILKAVLRALAARRIGPRVAAERKRGFSIPVELWIAGRWAGAVESCLRESLLEKEGWIHAAPALAELQVARRTGVASTRLWYLFVLEEWLRRERGHLIASSRAA